MGKKHAASSSIHGNRYKELSMMPIIDELKISSQVAYPPSVAITDYADLTRKVVYEKILSGDFLIAHPEKTKTTRAKVSMCWANDLKLLLDRDEEGKFYCTGWYIHHARDHHGGYCGWLLHCPAKARTSDFNYHVSRCDCGKQEEEGKVNRSDLRNIFGKEEVKSILTPAQKTKLNKAISQLVLSTLRPYELANETFLQDLITASMEVGAAHGGKGVFSFDSTGRNKLISGDGVRKSLDKIYDKTVLY